MLFVSLPEPTALPLLILIRAMSIITSAAPLRRSGRFNALRPWIGKTGQEKLFFHLPAASETRDACVLIGRVSSYASVPVRLAKAWR